LVNGYDLNIVVDYIIGVIAKKQTGGGFTMQVTALLARLCGHINNALTFLTNLNSSGENCNYSEFY
jgi:hypothetical protein